MTEFPPRKRFSLYFWARRQKATAALRVAAVEVMRMVLAAVAEVAVAEMAEVG